MLERLANAGYIRKGNILLDYGCGKGRVDFFLSYQTRCKSIGIEYDERIYEKAAENKKDAVSSGRVEIELANAEEFAVPEIFVNRKNTMAVCNICQLKGHGGSAFHRILIAASRTETAVTTERNKKKPHPSKIEGQGS